MKTYQLLMDSKQYLNGEDIYYGDISRGYTSQFIVKMVARIVAKPEGSSTILDSTSEVKSAVKKIPFGQIGATYDGLKLPSNTVVAEYVVPVDYSTITEMKDTIVDQYNFLRVLDEMQFKSKEGNPLTYKEVKELIAPTRELNAQIREAWAIKSKNLRAHGASADDILAEKVKQYANYVAPCDYTLVIDFTITHIVNKPELKSTVRENFKQEEYDNLAYKESKYRKSATFRAPLVTIPLQTVEQYNFIRKRFQTLTYGKDCIRNGTDKVSWHCVITEDTVIDGKPFDMSPYKEHDKRISKIKI